MMKAGDRIPSIKLVSDSGDTVDLGVVASEGKAVVYFYPRDDTPGCTREAQAFTAAAKSLKALGARVYGISKDGKESHCRFRDKYKLNFPLLSDPELVAHKAFGAFGEKTMYGKKVTGVIRSTFVIDSGKVVRAFSNVKVDGHVDAVLATLGGDAPAGKDARAKSGAKITNKPVAKKPTAKKAAALTTAKKAPAKKPAGKKKI
jgi:peroxiredoxin Q/BCP